MSRDEQYAILDAHFPDSILNPEDEYRSNPAERYDLLGIVGFCGCGMTREAAVWLRDLMVWLNPQTYTEPEYSAWWKARRDALDNMFRGVPDGLRYLVYYWLGARGFEEHGSATPGWLTEKGRAALVALELLIETEEKM